MASDRKAVRHTKIQPTASLCSVLTASHAAQRKVLTGTTIWRTIGLETKALPLTVVTLKSKNGIFLILNKTKAITPKIAFFPLGGARGGAIEDYTSPIECWCEVLTDTTLRDTKCPIKKPSPPTGGQIWPNILPKRPIWGLSQNLSIQAHFSPCRGSRRVYR